MITLSLIKNSVTSSGYYLQEDNYYLSEVDAKDASFWWGKGATELKLDGKVDGNKLQELLHGKLTNGVTIGLQKNGSINHRPGYDICFHAPKSVSILALDGNDKRFYDAHLESVKETLGVIERDCAQAKNYAGDKVKFERTKNLTIALIRHTTSRELDPHLHHHALVINATKRNDNSWRALASSRTKSSGGLNGFSEQVYKNRIYYGLIYQTALANRVVKMGYEIESVGRHGLWEIKGVPREARELMSKRRKQIEASIENLDYKSMKAADIAALDTREDKPKNIKLSQIKQKWSMELASLGFSSKEFIEHTKKTIEKNHGDSNTLNIGVSDLDIKMDDTKYKIAMECLQDAIEEQSQYNLKIDYTNLITQAMEFAVGKVTHSDVVAALDMSIRNQQLIVLDKSNSTFVTKNLIKIEKEIMDFVDKGKNSDNKTWLKDKTAIDIVDSEIRSLALNVLESSNRVNLVEHTSDNIKDFTQAVLDLSESSGKTVRILSPNRLAANEINENIKRKSNNLWQWLISLAKPRLGESVPGFNYTYSKEIDGPFLSFRQGKEVIVVNNAETVGATDVHALLNLTEKTNAKLIFLRDVEMKDGFAAGNPMETIKKAGVDIFKIKSSARSEKQDPVMTGIKDAKDRIIQLAKVYAAKSDQERVKTTVFVGSKEQINEANKVIREELKNLKKLDLAEHNIHVLNPVYISKPDSKYASKYQKNMVLRFYSNRGISGDWEINRIDNEKNILHLVEKDNSGTVFWNPKHKARDGISEYMVFRKEVLQISSGDKLITTANMRDLGIKTGTQVVIKEISDHKEVGKAKVTLLCGKKTIKTTLNNLNNGHFKHDYATTLSKYSKRATDHILANLKSYLLDKSTFSELSSYAKKSLTIFTDDVSVAEGKFSHTPIKLTAAETILNAINPEVISGVERIIDNKTIKEVENDIKSAIDILYSRSDINKKAEERAVEYALEKITSHNAGFEHKELVAGALEYAIKEHNPLLHNGVTTLVDVLKVIDEKRITGELVMGRSFEDGTKWTTKEILDLEKSIIKRVTAGKDSLKPLLDPMLAKKLIDKTTLTQDQKQACNLVVTTKDKFVIVQGYAGTGKTTMFAHIKDMLNKSENVEMLALAPTHRAVRELSKKGIESQTLKRFLTDRHSKPISDKNENTNLISDLDKKLIILDEASMISNKDSSQFLDIIDQAKARVVLSGDIAQHLSISSGKPYELLQKSNSLKSVYLREIVRQENLNLKRAVQNTIDKDYVSAFQKIEKENPQNHITRSNDSDFFKNLHTSIVEINDKQVMQQIVADDFLSRTPEIRNQTVVIVHANSDRREVAERIRDGLKAKGVIGNNGINANCLIPKCLTSADLKSLKSYNVDNVIRFGKKYYYISAVDNDNSTKSLLLRDEAGKTKYFYPEKYVDKYNVELYDHLTSELADGDVIRFTKTDKEVGLFTNYEYRVNKIVGDLITLINTDDKNQTISINPKEFCYSHWDYAQTVTGYGVQGASKKYAIDVELTNREKLANQRSFYIAISRAIKHIVIYTNNKKNILALINKNKGDKYAALEVTGEIASYNPDILHAKTNNIIEDKNAISEKGEQNLYDAKELKKRASDLAEYFAERLLGKPNPKLSTLHEWRYGKKGSLAISMSGDTKGLWHNFETGESGNLLSLIQKITGLSFRESLAYVSGSIGDNQVGITKHSDLSQDNKKIEVNGSTTNQSNKYDKTKRYAQQLASESLPIHGTIVEKYLRDIRGINNIESPDIRYHPRVYIGDGHKDEKQKYSPAMLAVGRDKNGNVQCVQATYLDHVSGNKANLDVKKRTYSSPSGAVVSLQNKVKYAGSNATENITYIAEGVETGLSVNDAVNGNIIVTLGKSNFLNIDPEMLTKTVVFCLDHDGIKTFSDITVHRSVQRLIDIGKKVFIAIPRVGNDIANAKTDFNDLARRDGIGTVRKDLDKAILYLDWKSKASVYSQTKIATHAVTQEQYVAKRRSLPDYNFTSINKNNSSMSLHSKNNELKNKQKEVIKGLIKAEKQI